MTVNVLPVMYMIKKKLNYGLTLELWYINNINKLSPNNNNIKKKGELIVSIKINEIKKSGK
jgi:hypothetical protein